MSGCTPCMAEIITVPKIENSNISEKLSSVPMNVSSRMRTGTPYQRGGRDDFSRVTELRPALVEDSELESGIRREQFRHLAETLGKRGWGEQWIIALAQIVVIDIKIKR